jgi:hypothetical protein
MAWFFIFWESSSSRFKRELPLHLPNSENTGESGHCLKAQGGRKLPASSFAWLSRWQITNDRVLDAADRLLPYFLLRVRKRISTLTD